MNSRLLLLSLLSPFLLAAGSCGGGDPAPEEAPLSWRRLQAQEAHAVLGLLEEADSHWVTSWYGQPAWSPEAPEVLGDTRPALWCGTPSRLLVACEPSPATRLLQTAVRRMDAQASEPIRCEVFWDQEGEVQSLGHVVLAPGADVWQELQVEVPSTAGNLLLSSRLATPGLADQSADTVCWATPVLEAQASSPHPDVLLITIDTLRFDALEHMPYLRSLMEEGTHWEQAYVPSNWTLPSMASLFTGLSPREHGCGRGPFAEVATGTPEDRAFRGLGPVPTLAEAMGKAGYATAMFHQNPFLESWTGLHRGFERYVRTADRIEANRVALDWWLQKRSRARFLSLHYMAPHLPNGKGGPLAPLEPETFFSADHTAEDRLAHFAMEPSDQDQVRAAYRLEVEALDRELKSLIPRIRAAAPEARILIFADHGEEHWESGGFEHGFQFTESVLRVPLAWIPGTDGTGTSIQEVVPAHHLGTFLLEQLGLEHALPPSALGTDPKADRTVESLYPLYRSPTGGRVWQQDAWVDLPFTGEGSPGMEAAIDPWTAARLAEIGYAAGED